MNKTILSRKQLEDVENKYSYCPYCVEELNKCGRDYKSILKPLYLVTVAEPIPVGDGTYRDIVDKHWECTRCGNTNITVKTFVSKYCAKVEIS